jgi:hypothetical protein
MKRLFDYDPTTGNTQYFHHDDETDTSYIQNVSDDTDIIDDNKRRINDGTNGFNHDRTNVHVANIPIGVIYIWRTKYGVDVYNKDHMPAVKRLLNDSEWRYLRVSNIIL